LIPLMLMLTLCNASHASGQIRPKDAGVVIGVDEDVGFHVFDQMHKDSANCIYSCSKEVFFVLNINFCI
jgi:hypothetical protein